MVQRIAKLIGGACSAGGDVHLRGTFNGVEFINGPVTTHVLDTLPALHEQLPWIDTLAQFDTDTDTTGNIPVVLEVTGGMFYFMHFWMNYTGAIWDREQTNPNVPIDPNDPSTYIWVETIPPVDYYADPNTNTVASDGVSNLTKNGSPWLGWRSDVGPLGPNGGMSDWSYPLGDGDIVTFDFFVDPANIVLISNPPA